MKTPENITMMSSGQGQLTGSLTETTGKTWPSRVEPVSASEAWPSAWPSHKILHPAGEAL
jgi:hypothetical protein